MAKLHLKYSPLDNQPVAPKALNLLFVFQVNCPGCFAYGFPLVNRLMRELESEQIGFLGMSTAFEDFELNTADNTRLLLEEGKPVGETAKMLSNYGFDH